MHSMGAKHYIIEGQCRVKLWGGKGVRGGTVLMLRAVDTRGTMHQLNPSRGKLLLQK